MRFDLRTGLQGSSPRWLHAISRASAVFVADDGQKGQELWSMPLTGVSWTGGPGCGSSFRTPRLAAGDPLLGRRLACWGSDALPSSNAFLFVSRPVPTRFLAGGCSLHVDPSSAVVLRSFAPVSGSWRVEVPMPSAASLVGVQAVLQASFHAPRTGRLELSNAVRIKLGN